MEQEKQTAVQAFLQAANVQRPRPVIQKLIKIMGAAIAVPKRGHNKFHNYKYVLESDLVEAVRKQVVEHGLFIFPSVSGVEYMPDAKKEGFVTSVVIEYHVIDGETGDSISFKMAGSGHDKLDKGVFKAITGANKYALMKLFQIGTGDDPEQEETHAPEKKSARPSALKAAPPKTPTLYSQMVENFTKAGLLTADLTAFLKSKGVSKQSEITQAIYKASQELLGG